MTEKAKHTCHIFVGLPATGKSTMIKTRHFKGAHDGKYFLYSTDNYLVSIADADGLTYDEVWNSANAARAASDCNTALSNWLNTKNTYDVIWDQTNLSISKRRQIINQMRRHNFRVEGHVILPPNPGHIDDWLVVKSRLKYRSQTEGKTIPDNVYTSMSRSMVIPTMESEDFDDITYYNIHGCEVTYDELED